MIVYIENPKKSNQKPIELLLSAEGSEDITLTLTNQFLYTTNEHVETESKNTLPITIASKKIKDFSINLNKMFTRSNKWPKRENNDNIKC